MELLLDKVTHTCENGRGVYSFCMCPGGYVVNASSEPEMLAVNGMSYQARDSRNANSALIVSVTPADFPEEGPLAAWHSSAIWSAQRGKLEMVMFRYSCLKIIRNISRVQGLKM